ncbi:conserved hypothetical protein [endosymbiont of unidentified scaly snail isolate Monju]|nr:conserved hypothetical protein [endosymbiont of unidentified scaly snail isolate Monju]
MIRLFEVLLAAAMPVVALAVSARLLLSAGRAVARRRASMALIALLGMAGMLLAMAAVLGPAFLHGLGRGGPEGWQALLLLTGPAMIVFGSGLALWRLAQALDRRGEPRD